jgi:amidase
MTTNLRNIAKLLSVVVGYDGLDPRMSPESPLRADVRDYASELSKFTSQKLNVDEKLGTGMRIGLLTEPFSIPGMSEQVRSTVHAAATRHFTASGATAREISAATSSRPSHLDCRYSRFDG